MALSQLILVLECSRARASYVGRSQPHKLLETHDLAGVKSEGVPADYCSSLWGIQ